MQLSIFNVVEIDMHIEAASRTGHVDAAPYELFVGKDVWDAGDEGKVRQEGRRRQEIVQFGNRGRKIPVVRDLNLLSLVHRLNVVPCVRAVSKTG